MQQISPANHCHGRTKTTPGPAGPAERPERPGSALNNNSNFPRLGEEKQERGLSSIHGHQAHQHLPMPGLSGPPNGPVGENYFPLSLSIHMTTQQQASLTGTRKPPQGNS